MVKKLGSIGLSIVIALLASPAMADLSFWGGNMTGTTRINPTQKLTIGPTGIHNGTQGLTSGDSIGFATTPMSGLVADNQYLTRSVSGTIGKTISDRQVTSANSTQTKTSGGIQETMAAFTVASSDVATLLGNGGNIRFDSGQGANPNVIFSAFEQKTTHDVPTNGTSMSQKDNYTAGITSPGNGVGNPLTFIATGGGNGAVGFGSSIGGETFRKQVFKAMLPGGVGNYEGFQQDSGLLKIDSLTTAGTIVPAPVTTEQYCY